MQKEIIKAIKDFDINSLELLLDDNRTYMDVTKSYFLRTLKMKFNFLIEEHCNKFDDVFFGICESCNKGCEGITFLTNSGYYLDLYIESKDGDNVEDIYVCNKLSNIVDLRKTHNLGFSFCLDEKANFRPSKEYLTIKEQFSQLENELDNMNYIITLDEFEDWYNKYSYLRNLDISDDIFAAPSSGYSLYGSVSYTICRLNELIKFKSKSKLAADELANYYCAKTERDQLIWFFNNRENQFVAIYIIPDFNSTNESQFIYIFSDNNLIRLNLKGYEYVYDYFNTIETLYDHLMDKYKPLPEHYPQAQNNEVTHSLTNYLKLHSMYSDLVDKYGSK